MLTIVSMNADLVFFIDRKDSNTILVISAIPLSCTRWGLSQVRRDEPLDGASHHKDVSGHGTDVPVNNQCLELGSHSQCCLVVGVDGPLKV
jgi:hypothetical protein